MNKYHSCNGTDCEATLHLLEDIVCKTGTHLSICNDKSHNAPAPYPTMHHSDQRCADFCSEWCILVYGTGVLCDL